VRTVELVREGVRTFTDLAIVGVVLVLIAQVVGPVRGVVAGLAELAAMIVAAAVLAQPLVAIKLRVIGKAQSPIGGTKKAQLTWFRSVRTRASGEQSRSQTHCFRQPSWPTEFRCTEMP